LVLAIFSLPATEMAFSGKEIGYGPCVFGHLAGKKGAWPMAIEGLVRPLWQRSGRWSRAPCGA